MFVAIMIWLVCGIFAASIAQTKGYSGCLWAIIGFMFGPLAMIGVGLMEKKEAPAEPADDLRACPFCSEMIKVTAIKCRHCGSEVTPLR